mmetsp:Transcript_22156/g.44500  ORF Transcript_22156/g.44500 Transcript_22156/m.44500 type:complete len:242 (+) Transcript_22156:108-833(+)
MADNVILNIYDLVSDQQNQSSTDEPRQQLSGFSRMFVGLLEPLGLGMYHTSVDVGGFRYQFGSTLGITRTSSPIGGGDSAESRRYVPGNGQYRESIILGQTFCNQKEVNSIIQHLRESNFGGDNYHLAHRNCNHFSETFATALILGNELVEGGDTNVRLEKFPKWVNRLAKTTSSGMSRDSEMACNVIAEARMALECDKKVGWGITSAVKKSLTSVDRSKKKELTAKQKEALAKLKSRSTK